MSLSESVSIEETLCILPGAEVDLVETSCCSAGESGPDKSVDGRSVVGWSCLTIWW